MVRCRLAAGVSQRDLAERSGLGLGTVRDLEQGRVARPRHDTLDRIARALAVDPAELGLPPRRPSAPGGGLWIQLLGPVVAWRAGEPLALGGARQRAILAGLAARANTVVPTHVLIDEVWAARPPNSVRNLVHGHVGRLRRELRRRRPPGEAETIVTVAGVGYTARLGPAQLDVLAFRDAVRRARTAARAGDHAAACDRFETALGHWGGEPAAGLESLRTCPVRIALEQLRTSAVLDYANAASRCGRSRDVLAHLRQLAVAEPLDEAVAARLMLALAATGRQAAALEVHRVVRRRLVEQLGISPGAELAAAQLRVLRQDVPVEAVGSPGSRRAAAP